MLREFLTVQDDGLHQPAIPAAYKTLRIENGKAVETDLLERQ